MNNNKKIIPSIICLTLASLFLLTAIASSFIGCTKENNNSSASDKDSSSDDIISFPDDSEIDDPESQVEYSDPESSDASSSSDTSSKIVVPVVYKFNPKHCIIYEPEVDYVHYSVKPDTLIAPASTTKLMTATVALKYLSVDDIITVGAERKLVPSDSSVAGISVGDVFTVSQLIDAMLICSGGDAAYTLAAAAGKRIIEDKPASSEISSDVSSETSVITSSDIAESSEVGSESESSFVSESSVISQITSETSMLFTQEPEESEIDYSARCIKVFMDRVNEYVAEHGYTGCHYVTPDGNDADGQTVTVSSLARIVSDALKIDAISKSASKLSTDLTFTSTGKTKTIYTTNKLMRPTSQYYSKYVVGGKTGTTTEAGNCLAVSVKIGERTFIIITMKARNDEFRYRDVLNLIDIAKTAKVIETSSVPTESSEPSESSEITESSETVDSSSDVSPDVSSDVSSETSSDISSETSSCDSSETTSETTSEASSEVSSDSSENSSDNTQTSSDDSSESEHDSSSEQIYSSETVSQQGE